VKVQHPSFSNFFDESLLQLLNLNKLKLKTGVDNIQGFDYRLRCSW